MEQIHRSSYIVWSVVGLVIACTVFAVFFFIGNAFLYLLNLLRGAENDWIESAFRELAAPAFGSYAAMIAVHKILKVYSKNFIFFGFSTLVAITITVSLIMMSMVCRSGRFSIYDFVMQFLTAPVCITSAYLAYRNKMGKSQ